jgi:transcriptional regulator with XRE-family HTH domain
MRMSRGVPQGEFAKQIGVTFQQVHKYENGKDRISIGRLTRIAKLFGVSVPYLLAGNKEAAGYKCRSKDSGEYIAALEMLGRIGAARLLKAFAAIPTKPAGLREDIVRVVEATAAAEAAGVVERHKRSRGSRR